MNAALVVVAWLAFCILWRAISEGKFIQRQVDRLGSFGVLVQWYTLMFVGLGYLVFRTFIDFAVFEYYKYDFLTTGQFVDQKGFIEGLTEEEHGQLHITSSLKMFALLAPVAGVMAAALVIWHVYVLALSGVRRRQRNARTMTWSPGIEENIVYYVIAMPLVFIVMAVRAEIRVLTVMTGSCWLPYHGQPNPRLTWEQVKTLEMDMFAIDLEVANFFQFCCIFAFGMLVVRYLNDAPAEYRRAMKLAGLQGVYLYVIAGAVRCLLNLLLVVLTEHDHDGSLASARATLRQKVMTQLSPVFTVATLLCVYNVIVLCKMKEVTDKMGNANLKFQGTRALVLISQIQMTVLTSATVGSDLYNNVHALPGQVTDSLHWWHLSPYRAKLIHASLLSYECLLVVLFNIWSWGRVNNYEDDGPRNERSLAKPLLQTASGERSTA